MTTSSKRWLWGLWLVFIAGFAALHALDLRADFPNHSPWLFDWAKFTDEGWYGNAAIRAHLLGHWYLPGDFNPAVAVPVWPFLEWILFCFTGVTVQAARGLVVAVFFANLLLSYLLLRARSARSVALVALTLLVTSPFLYCFSRLAILEPLQTTFTLAALNLAVRLPGWRRPVWTSAGIGLLFTLMVLTKTTSVFLLPALAWAMVWPLVRRPKLAIQCCAAAAAAFAATFGLWMALVVRFGLLDDFMYLFTVNEYDKPKEFYWPVVSLWWSFHGGLWVDRILFPLACVVVGGAVLARKQWGRNLLLDPVFGASILAIAGWVGFMTIQNHPQPRYYTVLAFFCFFLVAQGAEALLAPAAPDPGPHRPRVRVLGWCVLAAVGLAMCINGAWTLSYAAHPEYTFVDAAKRLTRYIDEHPNGRRILVSNSGDEISLVTHLPALCDEFGTEDVGPKLAAYQPGWFASWNRLDPDTLSDLHSHYSLEQVASFRAFDDPRRNLLVLFKLHPLPGGQVRDPDVQNLRVPLPGDKIFIPVED